MGRLQVQRQLLALPTTNLLWLQGPNSCSTTAARSRSSNSTKSIGLILKLLHVLAILSFLSCCCSLPTVSAAESISSSNSIRDYNSHDSQEESYSDIEGLNSGGSRGNRGVYLNKWAVQIDGNEEDAAEVAYAHGFVSHGQIGTLDNYYLFEHHGVSKRSTGASNHHAHLKSHPKVRWVEQQIAKKRIKRDYQVPYLSLRDPLWEKQWYLHGGATGGYDMNIIPAWRKGYTGKGVVITILDDGIEHNHSDLKPNYDPAASWDINGQDPDPMPHYDGSDTNRHGTRCAGEVAAVANNTKCAVGAAFNARIGGVRMLDGDVSDYVEAQSLGLNPQHVDIYSASWGPDDNGKVVDGPAKLAKEAFIQGILKGRGGKGSIFVWASGNGGSQYDSCNCDGYTNSLFTLSISSVSERGLKPWYLEECSSTLATTYSSGENYGDRKIVTTDLHGECTEAHTGTSASAPLAAAICALALEANPSLTWRDMQYVVMMTARPEPLLDGEWTVNGVGRKVSLKYGYGLMDAAALVDLAARWNTVPEQRICASAVSQLNTAIDSEGIQVTVDMDGCSETENEIQYLEHVQAKVSLHYSRRGDVQLHLVSPNGTRSLLLQKRKNDYQDGEFRQWPFMSVHFWGENPRGTWTLEVENVGSPLNIGTFVQWQLILYGVASEPVNLRPEPIKPTPNNGPSQTTASTGSRTSSKFSMTTPEYYEDVLAETTAASTLEESDKSDKTYDLDHSWNPPEVEEGDDHMVPIDGPNHIGGDAQEEDTGVDDDVLPILPQEEEEEAAQEEGVSEGEGQGEMGSSSSSSSIRPPPGDDKEEKEQHLENESWLPGKDWDYSPESKRLSCHHECDADMGCRGPNAKDCHTCQHVRLHPGGPCIEMCPPLTYEDPDERQCHPCATECADCSGPDPTDCLGCPDDYHLMETNHTCLTQCPDGYLDVEGTCQPCELPCVTCDVSASKCMSCEPDWELLDHICHPVCQLYHFRQGQRCEACISNCEVCVGSGGEDCVACGHGYLLYNHTCVFACVEGYYPATTNHGEECLKCHSTCFNCNGGGEDECTECVAPLTLHHQQCLLLCEAGEYKSETGECHPCDISCATCSGQSGYDCLSCPQNMYLHNGECMSACPEGHFATTEGASVQVCAECLPPCAECINSPSHCTACLLGLTLDGTVCQLHCSKGEYRGREGCESCHPSCGQCDGPEDVHCTTCPATSHLHQGRCVPECPPGLYGSSSGHCHKCHPHCLTCKGGSSAQCLSCNVTHVLQDGSCVLSADVKSTPGSLVPSDSATTSLKCEDGTFPNVTTQSCMACDESCATCDGVGPYHCLTCTTPRRFYIYSCVLCCSEAVSHSCCSCHPKTGVCMENRNIDDDNIPSFAPDEQQTRIFVDQQRRRSGGTSGDGGSISGSASGTNNGDPCLSSTKPCLSILGQHTGVQSGIVSLIVMVCVFSLVVFLVVFGVLQARSNKRMCWYRHYQPVPMYYHQGGCDGPDRVTCSAPNANGTTAMLSKHDLDDEDSVSSA